MERDGSKAATWTLLGAWVVRTTHATHKLPHLQCAYLALLPVQVELMLTNGHSPDRFYQRWAGVPRMHSDATMPKGPPGHRCPREKERMSWGYATVSSDTSCLREQPQTSEEKQRKMLREQREIAAQIKTASTLDDSSS